MPIDNGWTITDAPRPRVNNVFQSLINTPWVQDNGANALAPIVFLHNLFSKSAGEEMRRRQEIARTGQEATIESNRAAGEEAVGRRQTGEAERLSRMRFAEHPVSVEGVPGQSASPEELANASKILATHHAAELLKQGRTTSESGAYNLEQQKALDRYFRGRVPGAPNATAAERGQQYESGAETLASQKQQNLATQRPIEVGPSTVGEALVRHPLTVGEQQVEAAKTKAAVELFTSPNFQFMSPETKRSAAALYRRLGHSEIADVLEGSLTDKGAAAARLVDQHVRAGGAKATPPVPQGATKASSTKPMTATPTTPSRDVVLQRLIKEGYVRPQLNSAGTGFGAPADLTTALEQSLEEVEGKLKTEMQPSKVTKLDEVKAMIQQLMSQYGGTDYLTTPAGPAYKPETYPRRSLNY